MRPCQCRNKTPAFLLALNDDGGSASRLQTAYDSFLLTTKPTFPTIGDGRRSGGDCWRCRLAGEIDDLFETAEDFADMLEPFARPRDHYCTLPRIDEEI